MNALKTIVVSGVITGSIYMLVAVGLVIIYRASYVLNFAYGFSVALAAFLTVALRGPLGNALVAAIPAILASTGVGLVAERVLVRPISGERPIMMLVTTLGAALILEGVMVDVWGGSPTKFVPLFQGEAFIIAGFYVSWDQTAIVAASICLVLCVAAFFRFTELGLKMRAASYSRELAMSVGISPDRMSMISWGMAATLGAVAAVLISPQLSLSPDAFNQLMVDGFLVLVVAGFTNIMPALVGAYGVAIILNLVAEYITAVAPEATLFCLLIVVLLIRPHGLFGKRESVRI